MTTPTATPAPQPFHKTIVNRLKALENKFAGKKDGLLAKMTVLTELGELTLETAIPDNHETIRSAFRQHYSILPAVLIDHINAEKARHVKPVEKAVERADRDPPTLRGN